MLREFEVLAVECLEGHDLRRIHHPARLRRLHFLLPLGVGAPNAYLIGVVPDFAVGLAAGMACGVLPLVLLLAPLPLLLSLASPSPPLESLVLFTFNFIVLAWARNLDACIKGLCQAGRGCKN